MMRYYFAGRYSRHAELAAYRDRLVLTIPGAVVTSRWIDCHNGELEASYTSEALNANPAGCWEHGSADVEDLAGADAIVSFTEEPRVGIKRPSKGGRHMEHGMAIAYVDNHPWCRPDGDQVFRLIVVGPRENIFHCHPATEQFDTWDAFLLHEFAANGARLAAQNHPGIVGG